MSLDSAITGFLERDEPYDAASFGGLDALLVRGREAGASSFPELFFDLVAPHRDERAAEVESFVADLIEETTSDLALLAITTRLAGQPVQTSEPAKRIFKHCLSLFEDRSNDRSTRTAALKGAYLAAVGHERQLTRLSAAITEIDDENELPIVPYAARVAGLLLSARDDRGLVEFLRAYEDQPDCSDQVKLELGLLALGSAMGAADADDAMSRLLDARDLFSAAAETRDSRYEAKSFALAIDLLIGFIGSRDPSDFRATLAELKEAAFAYDAYVTQADPDPLLGYVAAQTAAFTTLSIRLAGLADSLSKPIWLNAAAVINDQLLIAYNASSMVFSPGQGRGVELLVRPRIEMSLVDNHLFMAALREWLATYAAAIDDDLVADIRAFAERSADPMNAEAASPSASAILDRAAGKTGYTELEYLLLFRMERVRERTTRYIVEAVQAIETAFADLPDFHHAEYKAGFMDLAHGVLCFAEDRLNSSFEQNRQAGYLFRHVKTNPVEKDLQQDFHSWSRSRGMAIDDEVKGKGGGRADLRYVYKSCEIVIEVKQETDDASFEALLGGYGSQASQYQVTNARLGMLLVLDKTRPADEPEHLEFIYRPMILTRGSVEYGILVVKIAALRPRPSEASR
ncbi:hypothetical protein [Sinorhizobium medicae]|uniref:hypothetical protein n=1 Tax=Sinorhizobium medicae TaxID=110321 RepID=UPI00040B77B6|nr:hypothetical protein [Sinorhizobium medicae]MDX0439126.1 hypothetical protein [Sinorhizobium medicae]MDX0617747.1 hypothetical protein [Sinorhizobium medicae]MDX0642432.1 hypothetical protein [Sinorhizobium medicae]MDX0654361.1 hypothetical protein [Sinorhizobium medicae]MDX0667298.1 hypothetical protein [Sinorhizobium medicae]